MFKGKYREISENCTVFGSPNLGLRNGLSKGFQRRDSLFGSLFKGPYIGDLNKNIYPRNIASADNDLESKVNRFRSAYDAEVFGCPVVVD